MGMFVVIHVSCRGANLETLRAVHSATHRIIRTWVSIDALRSACLRRISSL